jgi:hypothetical protein
MHQEHHTDLTLESLTEKQGKGKYWYTITVGVVTGMGFINRHDLMVFLESRGLSMTGSLPKNGIYSHQFLKGSYRKILHSSLDEYDKARKLAFSTTLIWHNGDVLKCHLTKDEGIVTEHIMNPHYFKDVFRLKKNVAQVE